MTKKNRAAHEPQRFWLSYDLGIRGDYSALYEWLDSKNASECGDSLATFRSGQTREELEAELKGLLSEDSRARVYIIAPEDENHWSGRFIIGKRKSAPWAGYFSAA